MTNQELTMLSVLDTLNQHVSIRDYTDETISAETLHLLLNAARRAPTSSNVQAYAFIVVRNPTTKQQLAGLAGHQKHIETCPVFVVVCADITRLRAAAAMHGEVLAQNLENTLVATVDAALAGMALSTAAESLGLGTVMIGGIRNHPEEVAQLLGLPNGVFAVFGMCIGYVDRNERPAQKPRLPEHLIIHHERYQTQNVAAGLHDYDAALAAHYRSEGRHSPDAAWTGMMAEKFSKPQRPHLRAVLEKLGFKFD